MNRPHRVILAYLGLLVFLVWFFLIAFLLPTLMRQPTQAIKAFIGIKVTPSRTPGQTLTPTRTPTPPPTRTPTLPPTRTPMPPPTRTPTPPPTRQLPALFVDGPLLKRSDTRAPVWLKGVNVEEFRQLNPHTFVDLLNAQGLGQVMQQKWGINLLRVAVDPETVESNLSEFGKVIDFAQDNGMYVVFVPFASAVNPARNEEALPVPDDLVAAAMGYLADQFKNRSNVFYGIWNEPHPDSIPSIGYDEQWQTWMDAGTKVAQSIRNKNPNAILVVPGGNKWARDMLYYKTHPFPFDNVVYDVHDYWAYPAYEYSRDMWTWAIGTYPILIGEFGGDPTNPADNAGLNYMQETLRIVNQNPGLVHYAMYALTSDGVWGIFTRDLAIMPKGNLLRDDLSLFPPTRFSIAGGFWGGAAINYHIYLPLVLKNV